MTIIGTKLEPWGQNVSNVSLFAIRYGFWHCKIPFREYLISSPVRKVARFQCLSCLHISTSEQLSISRLMNPDWSIHSTAVRPVGVPKQWDGGHVGVLANPLRFELFLRKQFLFP